MSACRDGFHDLQCSVLANATGEEVRALSKESKSLGFALVVWPSHYGEALSEQ